MGNSGNSRRVNFKVHRIKKMLPIRFIGMNKSLYSFVDLQGIKVSVLPAPSLTYCLAREAELTAHFKRKNCQTIPSGTLNMFYILLIHTDNAQMSFILIALCQPGGVAINFPKSARNQSRTTLLL